MQKAEKGSRRKARVEKSWGAEGDAAEEATGLEGIKARMGEGDAWSGVKRERGERRDGRKERWRDGDDKENGMFMKARCEEEG